MSTPVKPPLDQIRVAMSRTNDLFNAEVCGKRNFDALSQIYTADACILPPGAPMISGRDNIQEFWRAQIQAANIKSAVLSSLEILPAGDSIVEIGRVELTIEPADQTATVLQAKYVVYWKQEDGHWKWHRDIWNQDS